MYNKSAIREVTGINGFSLNELLDSFRIKPDLGRFYSYDKLDYIQKCYDLKKDSGLQYSFIKKMPISLIKQMIRMHEDPNKEIRRQQKREYDKQRYLNKTK